MWIVRLALIRPYTFIVMAVLILVMGIVAIRRMAMDIFPEINIPVVSVVWSYSGISPEEMERRIVFIAERTYTSTVNDIEHIESTSIRGNSVIKLFFQPGAKVEAAVAQLASASSTILRILPPGITPPFIIRYNATNVPILQATLSSETLSEQEINDLANNFLRVGLATVQGATVPPPYGGRFKQIMVDIEPDALYAKGLSPGDVSLAINAQNLILPAGTAKMGDREYDIKLNSSPELVQALNDMPIRVQNGTMVFIRDVAYVHEGSAIQQNIVRKDGRRASYLSILKNGGASTLDVVDRVKAALPGIQKTLPEALKVQLLFDQSVFVRASINGVIREAVIAAFLTGLMILLFLGSWRSTFIVVTSIPLSILVSILVLYIFGETLNIMTLGGLSLAVGILVDDATVELENTHRNLGLGKPMIHAILDGASQIATPALVSTLCICIVFVPVFLLSGVAKSLFSPLAIAVIFAMLASYLLSRTLVPTMVRYLLPQEAHLYQEEDHGAPAKGGDFIWRFHEKFNVRFEQFRAWYHKQLGWALAHRRLVALSFGFFVALSCLLIPFIGQDFFPTVDAGQFRLHVRAPSGLRIEETERLFGQVEDEIHAVIPNNEFNLTLDNIGLGSFGINLAISDNTTVGAFEGEVLVSLKENHGPTDAYVQQLRRRLAKRFPDCTFFFQPADIVTQILNFGLPAPIDIQVVGRNTAANYKLAQEIERRVAAIPGATDVHVQQVLDVPQIKVDVDRVRAAQAGLTQQNIAGALLISLTGSGQTAPNYWLSPQNGVNYTVAVQTPQYRLNNLDQLERTPVFSAQLNKTELLSNFTSVRRATTLGVVNHYNAQPVLDVMVSVEGRDLGGVAKEVSKIIKDVEPKLARGSSIILRGQVQSMNSAFIGLGIGLLFAILLVYFLMVVNFQSWVDPFVIITALPGALAGILWILFVTQTTFSVPALMGAIMCIGVATSNSILLVTFANDRRAEGDDAPTAASAAGFTRLRPVLMTALAMIVGMLPMSLGLGEGGEQNAPLGRAVIGGLLVATATTLFFVPVCYSVFRKRAPAPPLDLNNPNI